MDKTATNLLKSGTPQHHGAPNTMAYDFEGAKDYSAPALAFPVAQPKDLEAIVTLLELAAMDLTSEPCIEFTVTQLVERANDIGGDEIVIEENDAQIVLEKAKFVRKKAGKFCLK